MSIYLQEINNAKITGILFLLQFFTTTILTITHHIYEHQLGTPKHLAVKKELQSLALLYMVVS